MASDGDFVIRCKTENGSFEIKNVNSESTVYELKMQLSEITDIKPDCIKILCGYPPKALTDDNDNIKLKDVNIKSGETIIVEKLPSRSGLFRDQAMASDGEFVIRCKTEKGSFEIKNVNSESTVYELKMHLSENTDLKPDCIKILCGYPPKALTDDSDYIKLKDVNIKSGETIIVEKLSRSDVVGPMGDVGQDGKHEMAARIINPIGGEKSSAFDESSFQGIMMRHVVPSNNSCLFASVFFVLSNGDLTPEKSTELRKIIAREVSKHSDKYSDAFLGMPNKDYCVWIQNADHWGGAIELAILSEHFRIEIVAVDTISLKMHRFGENCDYPNRIFLIYDGIHYDPLIMELNNTERQTIFPVSDDRPMEMAMEIAREAKSSRQYTDIANFTLKCSQCNKKLRGDKEAREHAAATGHLEFGEITN